MPASATSHTSSAKWRYMVPVSRLWRRGRCEREREPMSVPDMECYCIRGARRYERFPGRHGHDVWRRRYNSGQIGRIVGFAAAVTDHRWAKGTWVILDKETGEVL